MTASDTAKRLGDANQPGPAEIAALKLLCVRVLEPIRAHFGRPVRINSGFRNARVNAAVGSSSTSQHRLGQAADIEVSGVSNRDLAIWIRDHLTYDQIILENHVRGNPTSGWVHVSFRHDRARKSVLTMTLGSHGPVYSNGIG